MRYPFIMPCPETFDFNCFGDLSEIGSLLDGMGSALTESGVRDGTRRRVMLATEELVTNAITHGAASAIEVVLELKVNGDQIGVMAEYDGEAFDPTRADALPEISVEPGGFGLMLVHKYAQDMCYSFEDGRNRVHLKFMSEQT